MRHIDERVSQILRQFEVFSAPVPVKRIAEEQNINIRPYDLGEGVSGALIIDGENATIVHSPSHSPVRVRFTIAHELGHYDLHRNGSKKLFVDMKNIRFRDEKSSLGVMKEEREANAFAAALLMPKEMVLDKIRQGTYDLHDERSVKKLAKEFEVSTIAMSIRLSNLRLL